MRVKIKKLNENAVVPFKTYNDDFCYDVVAVSEEEIAPNVWKYGIGLAFEIERDWETLIKQEAGSFFGEKQDFETKINIKDSLIQLSLDFRPRSSIYKTGMVLSNSEGTVDEPYRGEVSLIFYHVNTDLPRYKVGDKIAQMKLGLTLPLDFQIVDELSETERATGGFGHTGK